MDLENLTTGSTIKHLVSKRLKARLLIYFTIAVILSVIVVYQMFIDQVSIVYTLLSAVIGLGIGAITSRIFKITWDHGAQKVISQFDAFGIVILVCYVILEINRKAVFGYFVHDRSVVAISLAFITGVMIGRVVGIRTKINQQLKENT